MREHVLVARHRFDFGGLSLEMLLDPSLGSLRSLPCELPPESALHTQGPQGAPTVASVTCSVRLDESLRAAVPAMSSVPRVPNAPRVPRVPNAPRAPSMPTAPIDGCVLWEQRSDGLCVRTKQIVLQIASLGPRHYVVAASIASASVLERMLVTLATTVAELAGALCLHATAVALRGSAVLLLGPSGAGKTTAAELLDDVACLSNDRVVIVSDPVDLDKHWVWSLPVGQASVLPRSAEPVLPLAAMLRVVQATEPAVTVARPVEAMLFVRQGVEVGLDSGPFEAQRLATVGRVVSSAHCGVANVALSHRWRPQLEEFLLADPKPNRRLRRSDTVSTRRGVRQ